MMTGARPRVGVVGAGVMGGYHVRVVAQSERCDLARVVEPTSKADSLRVLDELGVQHASLRTFFRSLKRAQERDYRSQIATCCFEHVAAFGDISLCLYDVTTLYFEAEHEDTLRKVGFSNYAEVVIMPMLVAAGSCSCCSAARPGSDSAA